MKIGTDTNARTTAGRARLIDPNDPGPDEDAGGVQRSTTTASFGFCLTFPLIPNDIHQL